MSYSDEVKKQAYDLYVEMLKKGTKEHNILTKMSETLDIEKRTLQRWRQDGDWSHRARVAVMFSRKLDFLDIILHQQQIANEKITPENVAQVLESNMKLAGLMYQGTGQANETNDNDGTPRASEEVDGGEIFGDDTTVSPIHSELQEKPVDD